MSDNKTPEFDMTKPLGDQVEAAISADKEKLRLESAKAYMNYITEFSKHITRVKNGLAKAEKAKEEWRRDAKAEIDAGGDGCEAYQTHYTKAYSALNRATQR